MTLAKDDKKELIDLMAQAIDDVIVPRIDEAVNTLKEELASKEDLKEVKMDIESLHRKFDAQQNRQDKHNERLEKLERLHPNNKHIASV